MGCGASSATETRPIQARTPSDRAQPMGAPGSSGLQKYPPFRYGTPVTPVQLEARRTEFWQTRVDGNALMWQAIRSAAEAMLQDDVGLATAILEASEIRVPNGMLDICYDERGFQYKVPNFCLANPTDMFTGNAAPVEVSTSATTNQTKNKKVGRVDSRATEASNNGAAVHLKIRVNPGDITMQMNMSSSDTVADLKHSILMKSIEMGESTIQTCDEKRQRVLFMGKELKDKQTLGDIGVDESRVIQIFMRPKPAS